MSSNSLEAFVTLGGGEKRNTSVTGAQRDTQEGKYRFDLIGIHMLKRLAALLERGARKYSERNWEKGQEVSRTLASLWRHLVAYQEGDRTEDHLAAIVFNAMSIMHVEGEVMNGKLPAQLLDLPFYAKLSDFIEAAKQPSWAEKIVLEAMDKNQSKLDGYVSWMPFNQIRKATFPSLNENDFAEIMRGLTVKGFVCPAVVMERVHPDYALKSAVDAELDEDDLDSAEDWDYESGYDQEGSDEYDSDDYSDDDSYSDDTSEWGDTGYD